jgi:LytR cell envelope-related transcriptional attenuator
VSAMASVGGGSGERGRPREGGRVNSAVRGAGLIGLAVIVGIVLLQVIDKGPSGGGTPASNTSGTTTTTSTSQGSTPGSSQPATTAASGAKPRAEVRVVVFNAGATSGAAGDMTNKLRVQGYQLAPPSNTTPRTGTVVACKQGFEKEAAQLQADVGAGATTEPFPNPGSPGSENVNCIVLVGR